MMAERFLFCGFLPSKAGARRTELERLQAMVVAGGEPLVLVFYEAPHRILEMLEDVAGVWGAECRVVLARELTKLHEEFIRGPVAKVVEQLKNREIRGEITLLVGKAEPRSATASPNPKNLHARLRQIMAEQNLDEKTALKALAKEIGVSKSEAYRELQRTKPNK